MLPPNMAVAALMCWFVSPDVPGLIGGVFLVVVTGGGVDAGGSPIVRTFPDGSNIATGAPDTGFERMCQPAGKLTIFGLE